jgi:hypothetical protein
VTGGRGGDLIRGKVHSFQTLLGDLATIVKNRIQPTDKNFAAFDMLTEPTVIQQRTICSTSRSDSTDRGFVGSKPPPESP